MATFDWDGNGKIDRKDDYYEYGMYSSESGRGGGQGQRRSAGMSVYYVKFAIRNRVIHNFSYVMWSFPVIKILEQGRLNFIPEDVISCMILFLSLGSLIMLVLGFLGIYICLKEK